MGLVIIVTVTIVCCLHRKRKRLLRVQALTPGKPSILSDLKRDIGSKSSMRNLKGSVVDRHVDEAVVEAKPNYADHSEIEKLDMKTFKEFLDYKPPAAASNN